VIMSFSYNVDMFLTHFQFFTHCCTIDIIVVAKCLFSVALGMGCHNVTTLRKACFSCVMSVPCFVVM